MSDRPVVGVGAIVVRDEALLLIRRAHPPHEGRWAVPGGRVEPGELLAEAVVRELAEETGLEGVCEDLVGVSELIQEEQHFVLIDYHVTLLDPEAELAPATDAGAARWVPLHEVAEMDLVPGLAEFLADHHVIDLIT